MKKVVSIVVCVTFFIGMYFFIKSETKEIGKWPESIVNNDYEFCTPKALEKCKAGNWIGFLDSGLPAFSKGTDPQNEMDLRHVYCQPIGDPPSSQTYRIISMPDKDTLYLCRLDHKNKISEKIEIAIKASKP